MEAYKQIMVIEYRELKERADKLAAMLDKWENRTLDFTPTCPKYLLDKQLETMQEYAGILQTRAKLEDVDLDVDAPVEKARWIPVSEGLPEEQDSIFAKYYGTDRWLNGMFRKASNPVIVTVTYPSGKANAVTTAQVVEGEWRSKALRMYEGAKIIAWMPLPEPYEGEENE